jgi:hypothetical protein
MNSVVGNISVLIPSCGITSVWYCFFSAHIPNVRSVTLGGFISLNATVLARASLFIPLHRVKQWKTILPGLRFGFGCFRTAVSNRRSRLSARFSVTDVKNI